MLTFSIPKVIYVMSIVKVESAVNTEIQCDISYVWGRFGRPVMVIAWWSSDCWMQMKRLSDTGL